MMVVRFLVAAALAFSAFGALPARSEPSLLWTRDDLGEQAYLLQILPENGIAIAAIVLPEAESDPASLSRQQAIAVLDLETGDTKKLLIPHIADQTYAPTVFDLVAGEGVIAVLAHDEEGGDTRSYHLFGYDADSLEPLYQTILPTEAFPDHGAESGGIMIGGGKLLVPTHLRSSYTGDDPIIQVFDLRSGAFERGLGLLETDPDAKEGWFGGRPEARGYFFLSSLVQDVTLYVNDDEAERVLTYDLAKNEKGPVLSLPEHESLAAALVAADDKRLFYALATPLASQGGNIVKTGEIWAVSRDDPASQVVFPDPIPGGDLDMDLPQFILEEMQTGAAPYVGSMFPGLISLSEKYLVAAVPNTPAPLNGLPLMAVFDINTGERLDLFVPGSDPAQRIYIDNFVGEGDLLLASVVNYSESMVQAPHDLRLYRLDYQ